MRWFGWFRRPRTKPLEYPVLSMSGGFCDAQRDGQRCVKVASHIGLSGTGAEHDFGGHDLLDYSKSENASRLVPAQALVDALVPKEYQAG